MALSYVTRLVQILRQRECKLQEAARASYHIASYKPMCLCVFVCHRIIQYICSYVCVCVCVYMCTHTRTHTHTNAHAHTRTAEGNIEGNITHILTLAHTHTHTHTHTHEHTRTHHTRTHTHSRKKHRGKHHAYQSVSLVVFRQRSTERSERRCAKGANCAPRARVGILYTHILIHVYALICINMHTYVDMHMRGAKCGNCASRLRDIFYIYLSIHIYANMFISLYMHVIFRQIICSARRTMICKRRQLYA